LVFLYMSISHNYLKELLSLSPEPSIEHILKRKLDIMEGLD